MPMVILDVCPRCHSDVSRRVGVITTRLIVCPKCQFEMFVTPKAVVNNWQFNAAVWAGVAMWGGFAAIVLTNPEAATNLGRYLQLPARTLENRLILACAGFVPAIFV